MIARSTFIAALALLASGPGLAGADIEKSSPKEVVEKVRAAAILIEKEGTQAFVTLNDPTSKFVWKDTYVFAVNCGADQVMANAAFPSRVGGDIKQHTDYAGKQYGRELCRIAAEQGDGWLEYTWLPRGGGTAMRKVSYVLSVPGTPYQVGAGIYDHTVSLEDLARFSDRSGEKKD